ncbi:glycosyltransferase family 2 protein [Acetobacteraceae bacterium KSS8]|uniref:Glycosyltransferase family 2 protein n=1 Tax=Endosaccharibacter trunci TaxID=2812733 RepID=A0ABT1W6I3_9PROT|nr:glycosyltransferase family 2 protein [Acetobacteraceae bacterium KSS8]
MGTAGQVSILLSTFNGAAYLPAQLASFGTQSWRDWMLHWRDDGSSDGTSAILRSFAEGEGKGRCVEVSGAAGHLGIAGSFLSLLRAVPPAAIVAFADQDDVWLPDKIERGVSALGALPETRPALYCSRQTLVDENLRPLGLSPHRAATPVFPAGLTQNVATGCTVMMNSAAAALVRASEAPDGTLHDWWSYLVVGAAGGVVINDPVPTVLYRQHIANAVGAPHSALSRGIAALRRGPDAFMGLFRRHVTALLRRPDQLSPQALRDLRLLEQALHGGPMARALAMGRVRHLVRQTRLETALFRLWFLLG